MKRLFFALFCFCFSFFAFGSQKIDLGNGRFLITQESNSNQVNFWVSYINYSKDGKYLLYSGNYEILNVLEIERGIVVDQLPFSFCGAYSPALNKIAYNTNGRNNKNDVVLFDVETKSESPVRLSAQSREEAFLTFSEDGSYLAVCADSFFSVFDTKKGKEVFYAPCNTEAEKCLNARFSANGTSLYVLYESLANDEQEKSITLRIYDLPAFECKKNFSFKTSGSDSYFHAFAGDDYFVYSKDHKNHIIHINSGRELFAEEDRVSTYYDALFYGTGGRFYTAEFNAVTLHVAGNQDYLKNEDVEGMCLAFSADKKQIAVGCQDGSIQLLNAANLKSEKVFYPSYNAERQHIAHSKEHEFIAVYYPDGKTTCFAKKTYTEEGLVDIFGHVDLYDLPEKVMDIDFFHNRPAFAYIAHSASKKGYTLGIYDFETQTNSVILDQISAGSGLAINTDGTQVAVGGWKTITYYDIEQKSELKEVECVGRIKASPKGKYISSDSFSDGMQIFEFGADKPYVQGKDMRLPEISDSEKLLVVKNERNVAVCSLEERSIIKSIKSPFLSVAVSGDGAYLALNAEYNVVGVYDWNTSDCVQSFSEVRHYPKNLFFSSDDEFVISQDETGLIRFFGTSSAKNELTFFADKNGEWMILTPSAKLCGSEYALKNFAYVSDGKMVQSAWENRSELYSGIAIAEVFLRKNVQYRPEELLLLEGDWTSLDGSTLSIKNNLIDFTEAAGQTAIGTAGKARRIQGLFEPYETALRVYVSDCRKNAQTDFADSVEIPYKLNGDSIVLKVDGDEKTFTRTKNYKSARSTLFALDGKWSAYRKTESPSDYNVTARIKDGSMLLEIGGKAFCYRLLAHIFYNPQGLYFSKQNCSFETYDDYSDFLYDSEYAVDVCNFIYDTNAPEGAFLFAKEVANEPYEAIISYDTFGRRLRLYVEGRTLTLYRVNE